MADNRGELESISQGIWKQQEKNMKEILVLIDDGDTADFKAVAKTVDGEKYPASSFLVVEDSESPSTWHLPVKTPDGKPDRRRMGAAYAALHGGYRGNKYEGPNKAEAISKLKKLYEQEDMPLPSEKNESENEGDKARGEGQGSDNPRQGDGDTNQCACPECGYKMSHEKGVPCNDTDCPQCGTKMTGNTTATETTAETTTASGNAGRTVIAGTTNSIDSQVKQSDGPSLIERVVKEFDGLKSALADLVGISTGKTDILSLVDSATAAKAIEDASEHGSTFINFKGTDGRDWLMTFSTNAFRDRENEIFTTKSIEDYVSRHEDENIKGEYQFWHLPGTKFGDIRWQGTVGRFLVEAGTYDETETGRAFKQFFDEYPDGHEVVAPDGWGCSHKYEYKSEDREDSVYEWFEKSETTVLPMDAAANPYTLPVFLHKEQTMNERQAKALELIGGPSLVQMVKTVGEKATEELEATVDFKAKGKNYPKMLMEYAEGMEDGEAKKGVMSIAKAMAKMPPYAKQDEDEDEDEDEDKNEGKTEKKQVEEAPEVATESTETEAPAETETPAEETPETDDAATDDTPSGDTEDVSAPEVTGDKEYQEAVAQSFKALADNFNEQISALTEEIKGLKETVARVERGDDEKIAEKAMLTPGASLISTVQRAIGAKENRVDGRSTYAKDGPQQADPNANGMTPIPMLNAFITNADQK